MTPSVPELVEKLLHTPHARFIPGATLGAPAPTFLLGALQVVHGWTPLREDRRFGRALCDADGVAVASGGTPRMGAALDFVSDELAGRPQSAREPATARVWLRRQTA